MTLTVTSRRKLLLASAVVILSTVSLLIGLSLGPRIPPDVTYEVLESQAIPGRRHSLRIMLNKPVSKEALTAIGLKFRSADRRTYDRTLICYYLPGMTLEDGAWATTHFLPELDVDILGFTPEEEKAVLARPQPLDRKSVGRWVDNGAGSVMTIFEKGGDYYVEFQFERGNPVLKVVIPRGSGRFDDPMSTAGDHYVINPDGNLDVRDVDGLIYTATKP